MSQSNTKVVDMKATSNYFQKLRGFLRLLVGKETLRVIKLPVERRNSRKIFVNPVVRTISAEDPVPIRCDQDDSIAIILQGPIMSAFDYTVTTISRYREWYPSSPILFSTWQDESTKIIGEIRSLGCEVIISDRANFSPGPYNQNLQMATSRAALLAAKAHGARFVVKSRSDQRINNRFAIPALAQLRGAFPFNGRGLQEDRLVVPSLNTFAFRPYGVTDMLMFGNIDDMLLYWDGRLDDRESTYPESNSLRDFARMRVAEVSFCSNFLEKMGLTLDFSLEQYWGVLAERFLVVDQSFLDLHWPKYSQVENRWGLWTAKPKFREVSFSMWMLMQSGRLSADDDLLDLEI